MLHIYIYDISNLRVNLTEVSLTLTEVFPCFVLSCKANPRVKLAKTGHGPHSTTLVVICVVALLPVLCYVLSVCKCVLPPGDNPIAVNKYINISIGSPIHRLRTETSLYPQHERYVTSDLLNARLCGFTILLFFTLLSL